MSKIFKYNPFWSTNRGNLQNSTILESKEEGKSSPDLLKPTIKNSEKTSKKEPLQQSPTKNIRVHRVKRNSVQVIPQGLEKTSKKDPLQQSPTKNIRVHRVKRNSVQFIPQGLKKTSKKDPLQQSPTKNIRVHRVKRNSVQVIPQGFTSQIDIPKPG
jgi:hypothetical protein